MPRQKTPKPARPSTPSGAAVSIETVAVEAFDPLQVRPWRYHNRASSGMDEASLDDLAASIARDGQQQLGLARRLPRGDSHAVEAIFGVRRLEACRRAGELWRAEVKDAAFTDAHCATLMHGENAWSEGVSPLENAVQWKAMIDEGVFESQTALAVELGCHRNTVSRGVRTVTALFAEDWLARLVRPVMHQFTGRSAERLAQAYADGTRREAARRRADALDPGQVAADGLCDALFAERKPTVPWTTVFVRRRGRAGGGVTMAKIERSDAGGWSITVRPHAQSPAEMAELAEQVNAIVGTETAPAAGVILGRRLAGLLDCGGGEELRTCLARRFAVGLRPQRRTRMGPLAKRGCRRNPAYATRRLGTSCRESGRWA